VKPGGDVLMFALHTLTKEVRNLQTVSISFLDFTWMGDYTMVVSELWDYVMILWH
jgi:hypothetical protein